MERSIPLSQKLYLLGIHPEKGGINSRSYTAMDYVILGSLFLELYQAKKIRFEDKKIIVLNTNADTELYRFLLMKMKNAKAPKKISGWINKFYYSLKYIRREVQKGLVDRRLIKMRAKRFLFFKWKSPVIINKQAVYLLVNQTKDLIFKGTLVEDELILLSFIEPAGLLHRLFPERQKRKQAKNKLKQLMVENNVSAAVADAISAANAVVASVAVTVATTSSGS